MSKLSKFLELHGSVLKENESGSSYYKVGDKKIRVSDHMSPINVPDDMCILIPQNSQKQYIVVFLTNIYIHNSYTSLRSFLESWILISKGYAKRVRVGETLKIKELQVRLLQTQAALNSLKSKPATIIENVTIADLTSFTKGQQKSIKCFVAQNKTVALNKAKK